MKKTNAVLGGKVRRVFATGLAFVIVIGVPLLSLNQYGHFLHRDSRKATPLPVFQLRNVDSNPKSIQIFNEPLISVTFDDGWASNYKDAFPLLHKYGIHTTQFILTGVEREEEYLSWDQVNTIQAAGHEIGCHTDTHPDLTIISSKEVINQLKTCSNKLSERYGYVNSFASPYGAYNSDTLREIAKVFKSQRNTNGDSSNGVSDADVNVKIGFDRYNIIGMTVKPTTTPEEVQQLVDFTVQNNGWLVLTYHQTDDGSAKYSLDPQKFEAQLAVLSLSPVRIVTIDQAVASFKN